VRPSGADLAGRSVGSYRRWRALRGTAGVAAIVAATAVAGGLLTHPGSPPPELGFAYVAPAPDRDRDPDPDPDPDPDTQPEPGRMAPATEPEPLLVRHHWLVFDAPVGTVSRDTDGRLLLATGDGSGINLRPIREVVSAYRVGEGWAVVGGGDRTRLWWVTRQHRPLLVLGSLDALAVDRSKVAWRRGPVLSAAHLSTAGELERQVDTRLVGREVDPLGFLGDAVLLGPAGPAGADGADGGDAGLDTWRPAEGTYQPGRTGVDRVFGALPGGRTAVGLVRVDGRPCLARLDVDRRLIVGDTACPARLPETGPAALSPDGRWLFGAGPVLIDLGAAFAGEPDAATQVTGAPDAAGTPVWPDAGSVVYVSDDGVVRVWPDRVMSGAPHPAEVLAVPAGPALVFPLN
jgi:hypothetical protein